MPLNRDVFDVDLADADGNITEHRGIVITHGDELRAELEGSKRSIPLNLSLHLTSLMLWAGCVRLGIYAGKYDEWKNGGLVAYARAEAAVPVDPTHEAERSGPASPSPATSPASSTGSTPTSTND
jgi:hypothetical protein